MHTLSFHGVVGLIMNLISKTYHSYEMRKYVFICTLELLNNLKKKKPMLNYLTFTWHNCKKGSHLGLVKINVGFGKMCVFYGKFCVHNDKCVFINIKTKCVNSDNINDICGKLKFTINYTKLPQ